MCVSCRGKKLKEGKLPFFAAGISSVIHPVKLLPISAQTLPPHFLSRVPVGLMNTVHYLNVHYFSCILIAHIVEAGNADSVELCLLTKVIVGVWVSAGLFNLNNFI